MHIRAFCVQTSFAKPKLQDWHIGPNLQNFAASIIAQSRTRVRLELLPTRILQTHHSKKLQKFPSKHANLQPSRKRTAITSSRTTGKKPILVESWPNATNIARILLLQSCKRIWRRTYKQLHE
jgi:hypothetical protein